MRRCSCLILWILESAVGYVVVDPSILPAKTNRGHRLCAKTSTVKPRGPWQGEPLHPCQGDMKILRLRLLQEPRHCPATCDSFCARGVHIHSPAQTCMKKSVAKQQKKMKAMRLGFRPTSSTIVSAPIPSLHPRSTLQPTTSEPPFGTTPVPSQHGTEPLSKLHL